ncbi:type I restriction enzyme, S subunit [Halpernia humi]|uniref:Type I restriction enzyme, S subunit n=1 Tax=Halpernia humi TaxID=493375 RepID=A0A1H5SP93_9FLAO|nr:restriction endonuclease subunit S [Halpernia humi]SEF51577.1 type I restriction enzyme, S subunit [Halpernia humi]
MDNVILNDVINVISGGTPKTNNSEYWENGTIGWLSINDFNNDLRKVYISEKKITEKGLKNSSTKLLKVDDLIISARGTVGVLAQIGFPMAFNQSCFGLRGKEDIVDNTYLYYCLKNYVSNIQKRGQGSVFNTINLDSFKLMEINIENFINQKKIAAVLSALDDKIELNNQLNAELEQMAKTIYDYWFVQFDFPDENGNPYKSSGGKMIYDEVLKREIPVGWEVKILSEVANITMGQSPSGESYNEQNKGMIFFQGSTDFGWRFPENRIYTTSPTRFAKENDILLSVRAPIGTMNIAMYDCCIGRGLSALNSKENFNSFLIYQMNYFKKKFDYLNSVGTTFGSLTKDDLYNLEFCYPSENILRKFEKTVSTFDSKIKINSKQNQELAQLRDWLLPMLMNGQVRVGSGEYEREEGGLVMVAEGKGKY